MTAPVPVAADFGPDGLDEISVAGCVFAAAVAEVAHHDIGDPGVWECYGDPVAELARLRAALTAMSAAIGQTRAELTRIERGARTEAARNTRARREGRL